MIEMYRVYEHVMTIVVRGEIYIRGRAACVWRVPCADCVMIHVHDSVRTDVWV